MLIGEKCTCTFSEDDDSNTLTSEKNNKQKKGYRIKKRLEKDVLAGSQCLKLEGETLKYDIFLFFDYVHALATYHDHHFPNRNSN